MKIKVLKFGGTSVGSIEAIKRSADIIHDWSKKSKVIAVLSAMSGETDRLINLTKSFSKTPNPIDFDNAISSGENVSCALMSICLNNQKIKAKSLLSWQIPIITSLEHMKSRILSINKKFLLNELENFDVLVIPGFQGVNNHFRVTTLDRGGSDTSAILCAKFFNAEKCIIYTDVDGVYSTDPNKIPVAKRIEKISYEEMLELASQGAKVLQTRSVALAMKYNVKLRVLSSFEDLPGTSIIKEEQNMEKTEISGIAHSLNEAKITLSGVPDQPGQAAEIFGALAKYSINVDMIVQSSSINHEATDITFTIPETDLKIATSTIKKIQKKIGFKKFITDTNVVKISVVGNAMRTQSGIAKTMFETLANNQINIHVISTSEIKISVLISSDYYELAMRSLHSAFGLDV